MVMNCHNLGHPRLVDNMFKEYQFEVKLTLIFICFVIHRDLVPEIIDSGPMCITDLFQNKYLAYFKQK